MKKLAFVVLALAAAMAAAPASAKNTTKSKTTTVTTTQSVDNYNGFHAYSGAEHAGIVSTKTQGGGYGVGGTVNAAVANSGAIGGGGVISGNIGPVGAGIAGSVHLGAAQTSALSGSAAIAGSAGNGSSRVESGGYSAAGAGVRNEWGTSVSNGVSTNVTRSRTVN